MAQKTFKNPLLLKIEERHPVSISTVYGHEIWTINNTLFGPLHYYPATDTIDIGADNFPNGREWIEKKYTIKTYKMNKVRKVTIVPDFGFGLPETLPFAKQVLSMGADKVFIKINGKKVKIEKDTSLKDAEKALHKALSN